MAGKARQVDRSKFAEILATCDDGTTVSIGMAGDGTVLGTLLGADALDRKIIERLVGGRQVVSLSLADEAPPERAKKSK